MSRPLRFIFAAIIISAMSWHFAPKMLYPLLLIFLAFGLLGLLAWTLKHKKGAWGERIVSHRLRKQLPSNEYIILDDIYLPVPDETTTQIDHIIVSRYGIVAIETKTYSGWIFADPRSLRWTQTIFGKKSYFQNPLRQNYRHICAIADNLGIDKSYVKGLVVFTGDCEFKTPIPEGVVFSRSAAQYIRSFETPIIKDVQVPEIADAIRKWSETLSKEQISNHVANLKRTHMPHNQDSHPKCPFCGSYMVRRNNKKSLKPFWGCPNFPKCRGTRPC